MILLEKCVDSPPTPESIAAFSYTSGTTGEPKGVPLLQSNILAELSARLGYGLSLKPNDVALCYLPFPHLFDPVIWSGLRTTGASMGLVRGEAALLIDDVKLLRPTLFASVPRIYNKVQGAILAKIEGLGMVAKKLAKFAIAKKLANLN